MGEQEGILKLLFCPETLRLLGVHIIGPRAPELIHLGNCVLHFEGTIKFFINSVFNVPTLDEAYRIAAFNGMNRLDYDSLWGFWSSFPSSALFTFQKKLVSEAH